MRVWWAALGAMLLAGCQGSMDHGINGPYHLEFPRAMTVRQTYRLQLNSPASNGFRAALLFSYLPRIPGYQEQPQCRFTVDGRQVEPTPLWRPAADGQPFVNDVRIHRPAFCPPANSIEAEVLYTARISIGELRPGPPRPEQTQPITVAERIAATRATPDVDFDSGEFMSWYRRHKLDRRLEGESDLAYVCRGIQAIDEDFRIGDAKPDVGHHYRTSHIAAGRCSDKSGVPNRLNCGPSANLLCAICRAPKGAGFGIPAYIVEGTLLRDDLGVWVTSPVGHAVTLYYDSTAEAWVYAEAVNNLRYPHEQRGPRSVEEIAANLRSSMLANAFGGYFKVTDHAEGASIVMPVHHGIYYPRDRRQACVAVSKRLVEVTENPVPYRETVPWPQTPRAGHRW